MSVIAAITDIGGADRLCLESVPPWWEHGWMPGRRLNLTDVEAHDLAVLLMAEIQKLSSSAAEPERLRRLRAMLDRVAT